MLIRAYDARDIRDAEASLAVFQRAIRVTASRDYSPEQIAVWAPDNVNITVWAAKRVAAGTVVATINGRVVGFTDVDDRGYIDMMFVDPSVSGRGVATALLAWVGELARSRGIRQLTSHVSLTAQAFFEKNGFVVVEERHPVRGGVALTNFLMRRAVIDAPVDTAPVAT
ncbi:GNAT family N-acetyltransferase [Cryobacterium melibiosiphilum]|uniref:GNAT family N-acetyltransferase n=1 Tax=Cryobacterium melibiosiphilum TaxID=995039 RepID=A0A3A5MCS5_9MICO|nr:GNAT family N-acetyltransferase [Cryobacterium melibiosiphilum]RJT85655.1 GNAT family N-acetyltransferase [Cryobacterium melibiosiphilum]